MELFKKITLGTIVLLTTICIGGCSFLMYDIITGYINDMSISPVYRATVSTGNLVLIVFIMLAGTFADYMYLMCFIRQFDKEVQNG